MNDIPEDIERKADDVWAEALSVWQKYEDLPDPVPFIARAILAERERCANAVAALVRNNDCDDPWENGWTLAFLDAASIAIRSPERAGE